MTLPEAQTKVRTRAPGKINVYLSVGALQPDGYHDVATAYQAVSLYEDVTAEHADDFSVRFTGPIDTADVPVDDSNLALRAARMVAEVAGYTGGVRLTIEKQVPVAGGMGGGSADAAATLLAVDTLWGTALGRDELLRIAAELGADVPFAFAGGTAIGTGRGDELSPALAKGQFHWVLVLSDYGLSTPAVYTALDEHRDRYRTDIAPVHDMPYVEANVLQAIRAGDPELLAECLHNDLQAPAMRLQPDLAATLELGERAGALAGIVSGSGPTVAFLVSDADAALDVQVSLTASGLTVVRATGPVHGARVVPR
jgi:4-diphosphocytidyl-2-C-methyl-D-erythritol kinase